MPLLNEEVIMRSIIGAQTTNVLSAKLPQYPFQRIISTRHIMSRYVTIV